MENYELLKIIILVITATIALIQITIAVHSFKADHERRKKQATIEYLNIIRKEYRAINNELIKKIGTDPVGVDKIKEIVNDYELWSKLKDILGMFEHLAVGVNTGVFDLQLLNRMAGGYIIGVFDRYFVYIEERRKTTTYSMYNEYEVLVNKIKSLRTEENKRGKLKYS